MYRPLDQCVSMEVEDNGEKGILVTVKNTSEADIDEFRIRVLWFKDGKLDTVAYRWLEKDDHVFRAGEKKTLDFRRQWGDETYMFFFTGKSSERVTGLIQTLRAIMLRNNEIFIRRGIC